MDNEERADGAEDEVGDLMLGVGLRPVFEIVVILN